MVFDLYTRVMNLICGARHVVSQDLFFDWRFEQMLLSVGAINFHKILATTVLECTRIA